MASGYCEACNFQATNMSTHRKSKKHAKNVELFNKSKDTKTRESNTKNINVGKKKPEEVKDENKDKSEGVESNVGITRVKPAPKRIKQEQKDTGKPTNVQEVQVKETMPVDNQEVKPNQIQIIGETTGQKAKSSLDTLMDFVFSEQMQPITMSLLAGLANKLNGNVNTEEKDHYVTSVSGARIKVPNGDF